MHAAGLVVREVPDARFLNAFLPVRPDQAMRIGLIREGHSEGAPAITVSRGSIRSFLRVHSRRDDLRRTFAVWHRAAGVSLDDIASIGEIVKMEYRHTGGVNYQGITCEAVTPIDINLEQVKVQKAEGHTNKIDLDDLHGFRSALVDHYYQLDFFHHAETKRFAKHSYHFLSLKIIISWTVL